MPIKKCSVDGKSGYKYGDSGHCYTGPNAKEKALLQMRAIKSNSSEDDALIHSVVLEEEQK